MRFWINTLLVFVIFFPALAQAEDWQFNCDDYYSKKVTWKWTESQQAIGLKDSSAKVAEVGYSVNGTPVLKVDKQILSNWGVDPNVGKFALYFACARLTLGHLKETPLSVHEKFQKVNNADCWAINKFYYDTSYPDGIVEDIQDKINSLPREKWMYFPGPIRVVDFRGSCHLKGREDFR